MSNKGMIPKVVNNFSKLFRRVSISGEMSVIGRLMVIEERKFSYHDSRHWARFKSLLLYLALTRHQVYLKKLKDQCNDFGWSGKGPNLM